MKCVLYLHRTYARTFKAYFGPVSETTPHVELIDAAISISDHNVLACDFLLQLASDLQRNGEPLPANLRNWAADFMDDMVSYKTKHLPSNPSLPPF